MKILFKCGEIMTQWSSGYVRGYERGASSAFTKQVEKDYNWARAEEAKEKYVEVFKQLRGFRPGFATEMLFMAEEYAPFEEVVLHFRTVVDIKEEDASAWST